MGSGDGGPARGAGDRLAVVRPPIPLHLIALLALALGEVVGYGIVLGVPLGQDWSGVTFAAIGLILLGAYIVPRARCGTSVRVKVRSKDSGLAVIAAALVIGAALGSLAADQWQIQRAYFARRPYGTLQLTVREPSSPTAYGQLRALGEVDLGTGRPAVVEVSHGSELDLSFGQHVEVTARPNPLRVVRTSHLAKGVVGRVTVSGRGAESARISWQAGLTGKLGRVRRRLADSIDRLPVDERGSALLSGLLLGERARVRAVGLEDPFRAAGVSHILSVSGSHLAVVAGAVMVASRAGGIGREGSSLAVVMVAMLFTLLTGGEPATLRAWCMLAVAAIVHHGGRRTDGLAAVGVAGVGLLVLDSGLVFSVGFWLSVSAVIGLVVFTRYGGRWLGEVTGAGRQSKSLMVPLAATFAAQASTMPIAVPVFGAVSLVAPLANLVVVPLTSIAIVGGLFGMVALLLGLPGDTILATAATVSLWAVELTSILSSIPAAEVVLDSSVVCWSVAAVSAMALISLYLRWPQPRSWREFLRPASGSDHRSASGRKRRLSAGSRALWALAAAVGTALCIALWFAPTLGFGSRVVFLSVGQGDAVLVQSSGRSVLIDGGPNEARLRWQLLMAGCWRVDAVVATHDHDDHVAGLELLRSQIGGPPEAIYCATGAEQSEALSRLASSYGTRLAPLARGATMKVGALEAEVLGPRGHVSDPGANDSCLVLAIRRRGTAGADGLDAAVLVGGDAESEATLAAVGDGGLAGVSVLKVGHHGSADSVTPELLRALNPSLAVISVGEDNRYGHPTPDTLELLERAGVPIRRTDVDGRVVVRF